MVWLPGFQLFSSPALNGKLKPTHRPDQAGVASAVELIW